MKNAKLNWVRLPLEGVKNCRELGGYSTRKGDQVKWHAFLRSSDLHDLTEEDILFLEQYGVKTVIDLRGADEIVERPNPLAETDFCAYHNIPFAGQPLLELDGMVGMTMGDFYVRLIEESEFVKTIFDTIAATEDGGVIFHCAAGKDRTGVLAMLLLGLAEVERKDIVANYEVTYTNMEAFKGYLKEDAVPYEIRESFLYSSREYIETAYDHLIEKYGTFEEYLLTRGIKQEVIDRVKVRLGVPVSSRSI